MHGMQTRNRNNREGFFRAGEEVIHHRIHHRVHFRAGGFHHPGIRGGDPAPVHHLQAVRPAHPPCRSGAVGVVVPEGAQAGEGKIIVMRTERGKFAHRKRIGQGRECAIRARPRHVTEDDELRAARHEGDHRGERNILDTVQNHHIRPGQGGDELRDQSRGHHPYGAGRLDQRGC